MEIINKRSSLNKDLSYYVDPCHSTHEAVLTKFKTSVDASFTQFRSEIEPQPDNIVQLILSITACDAPLSNNNFSTASKKSN